MSTPSGPPHGQSHWARPTDPSAGTGSSGGQRPPGTPEASASPTLRLPAGGHQEPTTAIPVAPAGQHTGTSRSRWTAVLRDPLAVVLIVVTVIALTLSGLIGAELIARRIGDSKVAKATECVVHDKATATFGVTPPFLWQHLTGRYTNISIHTAGNQVKDAKQMKADLDISDVDLHGNGNSKGTIGALQATLTWPAAGIKETVQAMVPILGNLVSELKTNSHDGTVELQGAFGLASVVVKPEVVNGGLSLQIQQLTGLGALTLPRETLQPQLDRFAAELTKRYPLGLHADSIEVTDTGVVARFSTHNAPIPLADDDPCFGHL